MRGGGGRAGAAVAMLLSLATAAGAVGVGGTAGRVDVGGWAEGYGVAPFDSRGRYQGPEAVLALTATGELRRRLRFFLDVRTTFGGPARHPDGVGVVDLSNTFQNVAPAVEFEEGWADLSLGPVDVRVGKQKFAWGKLDSFQPTDVLNPRRYTDPFVRTAEENKIGVPAVRASYFLPPLDHGWPEDLSATLIWLPVPVAARFPLVDERWFPTSISIPPVRPIDASEIQINGQRLPDFVSHNTLTTENRRPPQQLDEGAVGLRLAGLWKRADWALYYYDGPETFPSFAVDTTVRALEPATFLDCFGLAGSGRPCRIASTNVLRPIFGRIRLVGADAATEWRGVTARAEAAWSSDRLLPSSVDALLSTENLRRRLTPAALTQLGMTPKGASATLDLGPLYVARDVVEWGVGVDRMWHGWTPVLQLNQTIVLDNPTTLLVSDVDTRVFAVVRKPFFAEKLQTEVGVLQDLARGYTASVSRFSYAVTDRLRLRVGWVFIAGSRHSLVGQYHEDDEGYLQVRYSY